MIKRDFLLRQAKKLVYFRSYDFFMQTFKHVCLLMFAVTGYMVIKTVKDDYLKNEIHLGTFMLWY